MQIKTLNFVYTISIINSTYSPIKLTKQTIWVKIFQCYDIIRYKKKKKLLYLI